MRRFQATLLLAVLSACVFPAGAKEPIPAAPTSPQTDSTKLDEPVLFPAPSVTGKVSAGFEQYTHGSANRSRRNNHWETILDVDVTGRIGDPILYVLKPRIQYHSGNLVDTRFEFLEQNDQRPMFTFQEAYVEAGVSGWSLAVGKQIYSWGVADAFRPTDVINPRDSMIVPDAYKMGVPSVALGYAGEWVSMEAVFVPWFSPARIARSEDRWFRDDAPFRRALTQMLGFEPPVIYNGRELPSHFEDQFQAGLQLSSSSLVRGWDFSAVYYRGFHPAGVLRADPGPGMAVELTRVYPEFHLAGGSVSTTWEDFVFHGEAAYHHTVEREEDDSYVSYIFGFNYHWNQHRPECLERATFVLEYAGEQVTRSRSGAGGFFSTGVDRGFTNSLLGRFLFEFPQDWIVETSGAYNFNDDDYAVGVSVSKKFFDRLECVVGADFLWGADNTFFGGWARNDRIYSSVVYSF